MPLKRTIYILLISLTMIMACGDSSDGPSAYGPIRLHFRYVDAPSHPSVFDAEPAEQTGLEKSDRLVTDQVLLLHCEDDSLYIAEDASIYGNDFYLNEVSRDTSASPALKNAFGFNGDNSYGLAEYDGGGKSVLNGTHGLEISFYMYLRDAEAYYEQRIFDCHDSLGGYTIGTNYGHLFFSVRQNGATVQVSGATRLLPQTWYLVTARFDQTNLSLTLDGKAEGSVSITGPITASSRAAVLGAGWNGDLIAYGFAGRLDEISVRTTVDYIDFDLIRLAVIDLSEFATQNEFYNSTSWRSYWAELETSLADTSKIPTWESYMDMWSRHFDVLTEQNLNLSGAFAQGTIRGVEGMNLLAVVGIQKGVITYTGQGFVAVIGSEVTDAHLELWPWEHGL